LSERVALLERWAGNRNEVRGGVHEREITA
jgi:hypothetical protein